jgi:chitodextrinase
VTAPTVPTGLAGSAQTSTGFQLNWTASTDAVGVTGYEVYLDGGAIATPATNSYTVTGRTASTTYAVQVRARDAAGNWSALSSSINVSTTAGADTTAPSVPTGVAASAITTTGFQLNWTASTDAVGVTGYEVFLNGVSVATPATNDYTVTGRTAGTLYAVTVRARDAVPNWSAQSSPAVNVTTTSAGGTAKHSIWGASAPAGTWTANTDGTPNIEVGNGFYRYGTGTGTYPNMRLVGGKVFKPTGITLPTGTVTMRWYVNTGGLPLPCPASGWGTMTASKTVSMAFVDGWNEILLDTPIAMPPNAGLVVITVQWNGNDDFYLANTGAKPNSDFLAANDGTKLAWSDTTTSSGLISAGFKIGTTYGVTGPAGLSYGTDIVVDEGP